MTYRDEVLIDTPVTYWRLGESSGTTAVDEAGAYDGTYVGATLGETGALSGDNDTAASFDGVDDYVERTGSPLNGETQATVEFWAKPALGHSTADDWEYMFHYGPSANVGDSEIWIGRTGDANAGHIGEWGASVGGWVSDTQSGVPVERDVWVHVVVTFDSSSIKMYLDKQLVIDRTETAHTFSNDVIRLAIKNTSRTYAGLLDEVAIYNYALSPTRIQAHYDAGTTVSTSSAESMYESSVRVYNEGSYNGTVFYEAISLAGSAQSSQTGLIDAPGVASYSTTGSMTTSGLVDFNVSSTQTSTASVTSSGLVDANAASSHSATASATIAGEVDAYSSATISSTATLTADGVRIVNATATLASDAAITSGSTILEVPQGVTVTNVTESSVTLEWTTASGATFYEIERDGTIVGSTQLTTFTDSDLERNVNYDYRVRSLA